MPKKFPNLLGQKATHNLSDEKMAAIIGVSRNSWMDKIRSGRFTLPECKALASYFGKSIDWLFEE